MNELTIVTAFFPICRGDWGAFARTDEKYLNHFKFWAGLKNFLIIYTTKELRDKIKKIRADKGLESKTQIVVVNCMELDPELYLSIEKTMQNSNFADFRMKPQNPESVFPKYNYIMMLKSWCLADAVKQGYVNTKQVAWMDFGFNHGTEFYEKESDFDFIWKTPFDAEKIHLFSINKPCDLPIYQIVCKMSTYIQGMPIILPAKLCMWYYEKMRDCMLCLNRCGLADDDQVVMLMVAREYSANFEIHPSDWCEFMEIMAGVSMKRKAEKSNFRLFLQKMRLKFYEQKLKRQYLSRLSKILLPLDL